MSEYTLEYKKYVKELFLTRQAPITDVQQWNVNGPVKKILSDCHLLTKHLFRELELEIYENKPAITQDSEDEVKEELLIEKTESKKINKKPTIRKNQKK